MAVKTEGLRTAEFLLTEANGWRSRQKITVLSGQNLAVGAVLAKTALGVGRVSVPAVVGTGNGTVSAVSAGPQVEVGSYVLTNTAVVAHGGVWSLVSPSGIALPVLTMTPGAGGTTVYTSSHLNFSITDGSTDFALGDVFTFVVGATVPAVVGTGNGLISGLSLGPDAIPGLYRVVNIATITNGGTFQVVSPDGDVVAVGSITAGAGGTLVLANQRHLNLTITDGSTDFVAGDVFNVAAYNPSGGSKYSAWSASTRAVGILYDAVDASAGDLSGVAIVRDAEIRRASLTYATGMSAGEKAAAEADLAAAGLIVRP